MSEKPDLSRLQAWRALLTAHATLIAAIDRDLAAAEVIPLHWYDVLIELYEAPERRLRMHEVAQRVVLSRSGLSRLTDRLVEAGHITREPDPQDKRGFFLRLTDGGLAAMRAAWPVYAAGIQRYFAQHLSDDEAATLSRVLARMVRPPD